MIEPWNYFCTPVYSVMWTDYLETTKKVSQEYLENTKKINEFNSVYPMYQTANMHEDERLKPLASDILKQSYKILDGQGYDLTYYRLFFTEFWAQEHYKLSGQERHVHGYNNVLTGFYFIDCPENSCKLVIHEPRSAKEFGNYLPEKNVNDLTLASQAINFLPEPGKLMITNSWLHHTFTKNESDDNFLMIHFNISAIYEEKTATIV